jgi:hypothetical protein
MPAPAITFTAVPTAAAFSSSPPSPLGVSDGAEEGRAVGWVGWDEGWDEGRDEGREVGLSVIDNHIGRTSRSSAVGVCKICTNSHVIEAVAVHVSCAADSDAGTVRMCSSLNDVATSAGREVQNIDGREPAAHSVDHVRRTRINPFVGARGEVIIIIVVVN